MFYHVPYFLLSKAQLSLQINNANNIIFKSCKKLLKMLKIPLVTLIVL